MPYLNRHLTGYDPITDDIDPRALVIEVVGEPNIAGAYTHYNVSNFAADLPMFEQQTQLDIHFQNGMPGGLANGVTMEALLVICEHRLKCFQAGNFPCDENAEALTHIKAAIDALHKRTERISRGEPPTHTER